MHFVQLPLGPPNLHPSVLSSILSSYTLSVYILSRRWESNFHNCINIEHKNTYAAVGLKRLHLKSTEQILSLKVDSHTTHLKKKLASVIMCTIPCYFIILCASLVQPIQPIIIIKDLNKHFQLQTPRCAMFSAPLLVSVTVSCGN